jgi:RHS repeat-associated protein
VWYAYKDQEPTRVMVGSWTEPTQIARVLDDGSSQISQATYNAKGMATTRTDPLGRQTTFVYAANDIDLVETRQTSAGVNDLLGTFANYTALHQPQTVTDAAGQPTTLTYNAFGQVLTSTNAKSETTTLGYDANQRLQSVTAPMTGAVTTYAYDSQGRVRTVTEPDGYAATTDYDAFDRPTRVTYPDGTTQVLAYNRLDLSAKTDRLGRTTRYFYDSMRRLMATRDPAGRTIMQQWCTCGSLDKIIDANGHATTWERDVQARVTREVRADGTTATQYVYESTTNRLKTGTDPKGQVTTYTYNLDDNVQQVAYTNATIATPSVTYTYDAAYARLATMLDGTGTTAYTYHPSGVLGATQVASVDGPLTNDTITYTYDELGRIGSRAINGVAATRAYDALGRVTAETNVLGAFGYGYDGVTARLASVTYPNLQTSNYSYLGNVGDRRLQTIHHQKPDSATLSKFDYTYDAVGNILTWQQQADNTAATVYQFGYDAGDQLTVATNRTTDLTPIVLKRFAYAYDPAGNRTSEQIDDAVTSAGHDALNRLTLQQAGGPAAFKGTLNEPASVTIQGKPVIVDSDNRFSASVPTSAGTTTVAIAATDGSGNLSTATYELDQASASKSFTYDANGNLTADGTRTFEWDARNQLLAVTVGTHRSEFAYDGLQRRVREVEKENNVVQSDIRVLWCGGEICEERAADGSTVTRRSFDFGQQMNDVAHYFTVDHLGSVREVVDDSAALLARYAFDPWGRRTLVSGSDITGVGYTGHRWESSGSLSLTLYRGYDADLGRWLTEDPIGFLGGINLYAYVLNAPLRFIDSEGEGMREWFPGMTQRARELALSLYILTTGKKPSALFDLMKKTQTTIESIMKGDGSGGASGPGTGGAMLILMISPCLYDPVHYQSDPTTGQCHPRKNHCES